MLNKNEYKLCEVISEEKTIMFDERFPRNKFKTKCISWPSTRI